MIIRIWRGWVATADAADAYQEFLRSTFLPAIHSLEGYCGATVLRRTVAEEIEFMTLTRFASVEAIRKFAGEEVDGREIEGSIERLLGNPKTAYIHAHYARYGCYAGRVDRVRP
jgi:heme-degrading monooxygenase HmoA